MSARRWAFVTASSLGPSCLASRVAAGCTCRFFTPHASRPPPTRVAAAFRTAHLHSGPISRTKFECAFDAPIIARENFRPFRTPKIWVGRLALAGLCSSAARRGLAGQEGGGREESGRRGGEGLFLPALDGCGLRRTASDACSCVEWRHPSHFHSALCTTPAVRLRVRVRTAGRRGRPRVRSHCCSRRQH